MNEIDLRRRFEELRAEESAAAPPFAVRSSPQQPRRVRTWAGIAAAALFLVISLSVVFFAMRRPRAVFTSADQAAAHSITAWHPPTDFLLRTSGDRLFTSLPSIPDAQSLAAIQSLKGVPQ
jgi:hypothetical protein